MSEKIIGRREELAILGEMINSNYPEFMAVYGRRRVGKTFLIKQYCENKGKYFFSITGIQKGKLPQQISRFVLQIGEVFYSGLKLQTPKNWFDTFDLLRTAINSHLSKNEKVILFFDELPWLVTPRSKFLMALEYFWNQYWSNDNRIKLIICGSSASWIIKKIINNKGGLHNRITRRMRLYPLNLRETKLFLSSRGVKLPNKQILEIFMVTGGIPYYLNNVKKGLTATQLIELLAFKRDSILFEEFDNLFASLFDDATPYIELLRLIAKHRYGLAQEQVMEQAKTSRGGRIVERLQDLEEAGFIERFIPHGHQSGIYYRVIDEYTVFYLRWIEPTKNTLRRHDIENGYWEKMSKTPSWNSWSGYAFETICYKHIGQIRRKLQISAGAVPNAWRFAPKGNSAENGAQIDLLFDRDDDAITICEIKYSDNKFVIDKQYANTLQNKIDVFLKNTKTTKQIFVSMICSSDLKINMYSEALVTGVVTLGDLFEQRCS